MNETIGPRDHAEAVALFRAQVLGALVARDLDRGELARALRALSQERFRPPGSDVTQRYAVSTLQRWLYSYKRGGSTAFGRVRARTRASRRSSPASSASFCARSGAITIQRKQKNRTTSPAFICVQRHPARDLDELLPWNWQPPAAYLTGPRAARGHRLIGYLRQTESRPIADRIDAWVDENDGRYPPRSKLGQALTYATKQRAALRRFLDDPKLPLDNNFAERGLRIFALGRKNFLFAGHVEGAQNLAVLQSIVATCRLHGVNPYEYIKTCSSASSATPRATSTSSSPGTGSRRRLPHRAPSRQRPPADRLHSSRNRTSLATRTWRPRRAGSGLAGTRSRAARGR